MKYLTRFLKKACLLTGMAIYTSMGHAQDTIAGAAKCFPSGTSLRGADISPSGRYLLLQNVLGVTKVFDLQTGTLVSKATIVDYETMIAPYAHDLYQQFLPYKAEATQTMPGYFNSATVVKVTDSTGNIVAEVTVPAQTGWALNESNGTLVYAESDKWYAVRPSGKKQKIKTKGKQYWLDTYKASFTGDGKFMLTQDGKLVNLEELKLTDIMPKDIISTPVKMSLNADNQSYTVVDGQNHMTRYRLETGELTDSLPLPPGLPLIKGFEIIMLPASDAFVYWLNFDNRYASGGLAYFVKDGVPMSLCDADWKQEQADNLVQLLKEWKQRDDAEEKRRREAALLYVQKRKAYEAWRAAHPQETNDQPKQPTYTKTVHDVTCGYCKGSGTITYELLTPAPGRTSRTIYSVDVYGNRTYQTNNYGYATKKCSACHGKGILKVVNMVMETGDN